MKIMLIGTYNRELGIDEELKKIRELIENRSNSIPTTIPCTSPNDFSDIIQGKTFDLIHISAEGEPNEKIVLPNIDNDKKDRLKAEELAEFLRNADVKCVVLNFCYSEQFAELIYDHVQCVIGIKGLIGRKASIEFSKAFYGSLGGSINQISIDEAFEKGKAAAWPLTGNIHRYIKLTNLRFIALKAYNNLYVSAKDHGGNEVVADEEKIDTWETFELIKLEDRKVALRAHNGQYVSVELRPGYDPKIVANRNEIDTWETFEWLRQEDGKVALKAYNGKFVCADKDKQDRLIADRSEIDDWEKFSIEYP
ncbi:hypothetical protein [Limnoraphis robusta]|uniref:DUF7910 domain-containing protein n=1 Tax=Limnoraphis robusta CCNP1315 TaxID=3110306 RepID=A0ABU5TVF2_9CYAN|nr:hypothetical protein [Limnoraphis robusta]MEA5518874.1 hypothetical protein [Limnoraphis robusta CCNP1315]MEA5548367.1 hypothetical protein [Limnoraphis robusta CCNP1324]